LPHTERVKSQFSFFIAPLFLIGSVFSMQASVNVTQEHNNLSRDGVYIDSAFTPSAAANMARDLNFNGTISGNVLAQPLFIEGGPNGPMVIAATESNNVYALNAVTGNVIWQRNLGNPATSGLPCGNINPLGISDTPAVDLASRSLFLDAMVDTGTAKKHFIFSLNVDTGATNSGWPVDVNATATYNGITFTSSVQEERGGLADVQDFQVRQSEGAQSGDVLRGGFGRCGGEGDGQVNDGLPAGVQAQVCSRADAEWPEKPRSLETPGRR